MRGPPLFIYRFPLKHVRGSHSLTERSNYREYILDRRPDDFCF